MTTTTQDNWRCTCPTVWFGIVPPPPCPWCAAQQVLAPEVFPAPVPAISDDDVERIARRVVELLKERA